MPGARSFNFADVWEMAADAVPERDALVVVNQGRWSYRELETRANRAADALASLGVGRGDFVACHLENCVEYVEVVLGAFKLGAVPVNVNFRYVADELHHVLADCGAVVVVTEAHLADRVDELRDRLPSVHTVLVTGDGGSYDDAVGRASEDRPDVERTGDEHYVIYTGGTTGLPKGVVWRHTDAFFACIGGGDPMRLAGPVDDPSELGDRMVESFSSFPLAPLMHAAGLWVTLMWLFAGGKAMLLRGPLDPPTVWTAVDDEGANLLTFVGDAVGRPMMDEWDAEPGAHDASTLLSISNGGAPMSPSLKQRIAASFPNVVITDGFGSSEVGARGSSRLSAAEVTKAGGVAQFKPMASDTVVLDDENRPVEPGSGVIGRVAASGRLPLGYLNDPEKTARTFVEVDGRRLAITGDMASVAVDGTIELAGRGSGCINTGGEKVFPEEVETVLISHPSVYDVLVVGADDARWGSAVTAIVKPHGDPPELDDLVEHCKRALASYKAPKHLVVVDEVKRSPAGKPDYRWAKQIADANVSGD
ncbi:MAG TPA: AMP-binding protein [Acidimicrobiales bacterium]|nr:AMP-binding protein [Acidimicrobiales bacterium]